MIFYAWQSIAYNTKQRCCFKTHISLRDFCRVYFIEIKSELNAKFEFLVYINEKFYNLRYSSIFIEFYKFKILYLKNIVTNKTIGK